MHSYKNIPKRQKVQILSKIKRYKTPDYITITDQLKTVSRSDNRHPTDVVNQG